MRFGAHIMGLAITLSAVGGSLPVWAETQAYGSCQAKGRDAALDDMEDGDGWLQHSEGRLGIWYRFNPGGNCQQTPFVSPDIPFVMSADSSQGSRFVAATQGANCQTNGWAGGGIGFRFAQNDSGTNTVVDCANGYDARAFKGLSFALKSQGKVRLQVCTQDVTDFNCHGYDIAAPGDAWRTLTIPWTQLLQEDWGPQTQRVPFRADRIVSIQFKAMTAQFSFAVDDLKFLQASLDSGNTSPGAWYAYKPQDISRDQLKTEYEGWKIKHYVDCRDGSADIRKNGSEAVSEGTGYGMLMAVSMDDRETFDRLATGFQKRRNSRGMMSWQFAVCGGVWGGNAATDADLDIAMALVMADRKWGGYRFLAEPLIHALKQYGTSFCDGRLVLRPGDMWGGCQDPNNQRLNPSYFAPAYYRVFASYLPNQADFWNDLARDSYALLDMYQKNMKGLLPDWSFAHGGVDGPYGYEACRVPWRIGTDFAWHGKAEAATVLKNLHDYAQSRGGPAQSVDQKNSCFIGGMALTATAQDQHTADQWYREWMDGIPQAPDPNVGDGPYYQGTLRVLYLLLAGGLLQP